jgi:hypothetical protein
VHRQILSALALIALVLAGCTSLPASLPATVAPPTVAQAAASATSELSVNPADSPLPTPPAANATAAATPAGPLSATGVIYTTARGSRQPLSNVDVRLARVVWNADKSDGAFVLEGGTSPTATTDATGAFAFRGVEPGEYVMVVGDPYGQHEIVAKPDGKPTIYAVAADGPSDWGETVVKLAP